MRKVWDIAAYTFREHLRHRLYVGAVFFSLILLLASLVVSGLANEEGIRLVLDLGLAGIEVVALFMTIFTMANIVLQEIENKTIYVTLSHPVPRVIYLGGRTLGTLIAIVTLMVGMSLLHLILLKFMGWSFVLLYPASILCSIAKIFLATLVALFFSLYSTSAPTAMMFTFFVWILGHFSSELRYIGEKSGQLIWMVATQILYYLLPNFGLYNVRDFLAAPTHAPTPGWYLWLILYTVGYGAATFFLAHLIFRRKEF